MTDETKNIRIKVGLDGLGETQRDLESLQRMLQQVMGAGTGRAGGVSTPSLDLNGLTQRFLSSRKTVDLGYSKLESAILAEADARRVRAKFEQRAALDVGSKAGFKDSDSLIAADLSTARRVNAARERLARELEKQLQAAVRAQEDANGTTAARAEQAAAQKAEAAAAKKAASAAERRAAAEQRAAEQAQVRAKAEADFRSANVLPQGRIDALSRAATPDTSALGRIINKAVAQEGQLARANERLAEARRVAAAGEMAASQSEARLTAGASAVATAEQALAQTLDLLRLALGKQVGSANEAAEAFAGQNFLQRQKGQFFLGFKGTGDVPIGQQVGQAFKFSLLYGSAYKALFLLTQTFQSALQEGIQFQQGLSDMAITTGKSKEQLRSLAENLAADAAATGASPSQGLEVGARSIGLYGATEAPLDRQKLIAEYSNQVVSKLAVGSGLQPVDLQANIAAITQALGVGFSGQGMVADLDAYFSKKFGIAQGQTFDAVAQSASVGLSAGFSPQELFAAAADLQSRTGQTSTAVGGYLAQIFSRGGEGSLTDVAGKFGIDTNQTLKQILDQLAKIYVQASPNDRNTIAAAFGRGKVQNAAVSLLTDYPTIEKEVRKSAAGAPGAADRAFSERMSNIGGQLAVLGGDFKEFAHLIGESGLLSALGLGVEVLHQFLSATNGVLRAFNELPAVIRDIIGLLAAAGLAGKLGGGLGIATTVSRLGDPLGVGAKLGAAFGGTAGTAAEVRAGALAGGAAAGAGLGAGATLLAAAPWAAAAAAIYGLAKLHGTIEDSHNALNQSVAAVSQAPAVGSTSGQVMAYAGLLRSQAKQDLSKVGFWTGITGQSGDLKAEAKRLTSIADSQAAYAKMLDFQQAAAAAEGSPSVFKSLHPSDVDAGLQQITDNGGTAATQLDALGAAILGLGKHAAETASQIDTRGESNGLVGALGRLKDSSKFSHVTTGYTAPGDVQRYRVAGGNPIADLQKDLSGDTLNDRLRAALGQRGVSSFSKLNERSTSSIATEISSLDRDQFSYLDDSGFAALQKTVTQSVRKYLLARLKHSKALIDGATSLSGAEASGDATRVLSASSAAIDAKGQFDFAGRLKVAQRALKQVTALNNNSTDETPQLLASIDQAKAQIAQIQIDKLEALRKVAVQNATSQRQASALGMGFVRKEIAAAVKSGSADQLAAVLQGAGKGAVTIAKKVVADAIQTAKSAQSAEQQMANAQQVLKVALETALRQAGTAISQAFGTPSAGFVGPLPVIGANGQFVGSGNNQAVANHQLDNLQNMQNQLNAGTISSDLNPDQIPGGGKKAKEAKDSAAAIAAARYAAMAAKRGGDVFAARAAVIQAQADISDAKKGTVAYYNALASLYQAQDQLNQALRAARFNRKSLKLDLTDPVVQARLDYQKAVAQLRSDQRRGKSGAVTTQDKLDAKNAKNALEQSKFDQRLSDIQTADSLGQVTHSAYIRYLQHEHDRLKAVAHRTRQQQDQLNQIDQLMLDASKAMNGAFNFGDIKLPTPYQVRRYVEEQAGVRSGRLSASQTAMVSKTNVYITATDPHYIARLVSQQVGQPTRVLTTQPRRR